MRKTTRAALTWSLVGALLGILLPATGAAAAEAGPEPHAAPGHIELVASARAGNPHGSQPVRALQRQLRQAGVRPGPIDGRFGPLTEAAVRRFQRQQALVVDGVVGPVTAAALGQAPAQLGPGSGAGDASGSQRVRALQRQLRRAGERPGPIDGRYGPLTEAAVRRFQRQQGLMVNGFVTKATGVALAKRPATGPTSEPTTIAVPRPRSERPAGKGDGGIDLFGLMQIAALAALALLLAALTIRRTRRRSQQRPPLDEAASESQPAPVGSPANRPQRPRSAMSRQTIQAHSGARTRRAAETARAAPPAQTGANGSVVLADNPSPLAPAETQPVREEETVASAPAASPPQTQEEPIASPPPAELPVADEQPDASAPAAEPPIPEEEEPDASPPDAEPPTPEEEEPVADPPAAPGVRGEEGSAGAICEIEWRPGYLRHRFRAVARVPGEKHAQVIAESRNLQLFPMSDPDPPDEDLIAAAEVLMEQLVAAGWKPIEPADGPEGPWYAQRFAWTANGEASRSADKILEQS